MNNMQRMHKAGVNIQQLNQLIADSEVVEHATIDLRLGWNRTVYRHHTGKVFAVTHTTSIYVSRGCGELISAYA